MEMNYAKTTILSHAGYIITNDDAGVSAHLRPLKMIKDDTFVNLTVAIIDWFGFQGSNLIIDREVPAAIWDTCEQLRTIILRENSIVQRNALLTRSEIEKIAGWTSSIEVLAIRLLRRLDLPIAFSRMCDFISSLEHDDMSCFRPLLKVLEESAEHCDEDVSITAQKFLSSMLDN